MEFRSSLDSSPLSNHCEGNAYAKIWPRCFDIRRDAQKLSRSVGRTITFVDVSPESMRAAFVGLGFPPWQADGLLEEFAMYRRGEATTVEPDVGEALGRPARSFDEFARDYAPVFT
jgi:hypothetical protein